MLLRYHIEFKNIMFLFQFDRKTALFLPTDLKYYRLSIVIMLYTIEHHHQPVSQCARQTIV